MTLIGQEENIVDEKVLDILVDKAKDYYKEIMCHRAIPDGRDGLTEIQRRIIWTCFENKWDKNKPHVKSAKVVGGVIADYHPHSNDSAYLTSAFLSQDWKQQVPLIEFHGSNGSISGADPAAMRYCVTKNTLISVLTDGDTHALVPIKRILDTYMNESDKDGEYEYNRVLTCKVRDFNDNYQIPLKGFDCGVHDVIKMTCDNGFSLTGTPNHPLLVMDDNTHLAWKLMEELNEGDRVLIKPRRIFSPTIPCIAKSDEHFAILMGYLYSNKCTVIVEGDPSDTGAIVDSEGRFLANIAITFYHINDEKSLDLIHHVFTGLGEIFTKTQEDYINYGDLEIDCNYSKDENGLAKIKFNITEYMSREVLELFKDLDSDFGVKFPKKFLSYATDSERILFLRAFFEYSLLLTENEFGKETFLIFHNSKKFLKKLQLVLLEFGVLSSLSISNGTYYKYKLIINDSRSFFIIKKLIGTSVNNDYRESYKYAVESLLPNLSIMDRRLATNITSLILKLLSNANININIKNYTTIEEIKNDINSKILIIEDEKLKKRIEELISYAYDYEEVVVTRLEKKKKNVYSIRVDSEDHSFISNGFISHNTEQRLSKITSEILTDELKSDSVDMKLNFNEDRKEPIILPSKLPLMLVNGSFGIASGYISYIPTHNPREVIGEILKKLKDSNHKTELLPDFPTGGTLCNTEMVKQAYEDLPKAINDKKSKLVVRCKIEIDEKHNMLVITELPYMTSGDSIMTSIKNAITPPKGKEVRGVQQQPTITSISNIKNVTAKGKVKINVYCKRGANLETVKNQLFRYTNCQTTIPLSFVYCIGETFKTDCKSVDDYLNEFISFRKDTIKRIKTSVIRQKKFRMNIIEGLFIILDDDVIDEVFAKIRTCNSRQEIYDMLMNDYGLNNVQAEKVSEYKLYQLASFAVDELRNEYEKLGQEIEDELEYFQNPKKFNEFMINEYKELLDKYFTEKKYPRRTVLENIALDGEIQLLESIPDENYIMIFTKHGYVKKLEMVKTQKRNTKGISVGKLKDEDYVIGTTVLNSRDNILIFTASGKVYKYKVYEIPKCKTSALGYFLSKDINGEKIVNIIPFTDDEFDSEDIAIVSASKYNCIKITPISEYKNIRNSGIISMKLKENFKLKNGERITSDEVIGVQKISDYTSETGSVIALNSKGNAIRVLYSKIPNCLRNTYGSTLFANTILSEGHTVKTIYVVDGENNDYYFYISKNGLGKRMNLDAFEPQYRGTKGKVAAKLREDDSAEALITVKESDSIVIVSNKNLVKVKISDTPLVKRVTYGNLIKKCTDDEYVIDVGIDVTL